MPESTITICTDASFFPSHKRAAWACYIRSKNHLVKKSGIFQGEIVSAIEAERRGIANALYIADQLEDLSRLKIILYCDNVGAMSPRPLTKTRASKYYWIAKKYNEWYDEHIGNVLNKAHSFELRHVKGHLSKGEWSSSSARNFMNDWADREARSILKKYVRNLEREAVYDDPS
jgi:ribonuclease HI